MDCDEPKPFKYLPNKVMVIHMLAISFNGISNLVGYLMPNLVFCIHDFMCINELIEIIFINHFSVVALKGQK